MSGTLGPCEVSCCIGDFALDRREAGFRSCSVPLESFSHYRFWFIRRETKQHARVRLTVFFLFVYDEHKGQKTTSPIHSPRKCIVDFVFGNACMRHLGDGLADGDEHHSLSEIAGTNRSLNIVFAVGSLTCGNVVCLGFTML